MKRAAAALVAAALLGACSGGSDGAPPTTTTQPTIATTAPTTTSVATTTTAAPACAGRGPLGGGPDQVDAAADVDGDGLDDQLRSFRLDGDVVAVRVELAAGGGAETTLRGDGVATIGVLGGFDVDGDGDDEVWVRVGAGASTTILSLFELDGCDLRRATLGDGTAVELPVGGSVGSTAGVECAPPGIVVRTGTSSGGDAYDVTATGYALVEGQLQERSTTSETATFADRAFEVASSFVCGDL